MTDVLGICLRWSDGECVVQPENGPAVTIPLRLIVSGKPVPPRPSVRHRVSAREIELRAGVLWPELRTEPLGEWVLRVAPPFEGRLLRRSNSVLAMGDPGMPPDAATERVRDFYIAHDRSPLAMVEVGSPLEAELLALGSAGIDLAPAHAMLASVSRAVRACGVPPPDVPPVEEDGGVLLDLGDARGRAALDDEWLGLHSIHVAPERRRQGLATRVVSGLLAWGAERGATTAWLHVESDNEGAVALYERLGFRIHHSYRYLSPPPDLN